MATPMPAPDVLNREYLEMRAKILELAASFDRLDRGGGGVMDDSRMQLIQQGISVLQQDKEGKAEEIQMIFSREYRPDWRNEMNV